MKRHSGGIVYSNDLLLKAGRPDLIDRFVQEVPSRTISNITNQDDGSLSPWEISRVAVVGNGGVINERKWGELIDSFDRVIRFNHAIKGGNEDHAGSKTTDLVINCHAHSPTSNTFKQGYSSLREGWMSDLSDLNVIYVNSDPQNIADRGQVPEACTFFKMSRPEFHLAQSEFGLPKPSTVGFALVACLVRNDIIPNLFGFSTEPEDTWDHYFEDRPPPSGCHANDSEKIMIARLHHAGKLTVYR